MYEHIQTLNNPCNLQGERIKAHTVDFSTSLYNAMLLQEVSSNLINMCLDVDDMETSIGPRKNIQGRF